MTKRGDQDKYNRLLDAFDARNKTFQKSVIHLLGLGFTYGQANNAVHVYRKGGATQASFRLSREHRNQLLDDFRATNKTPKECVNYLMESHGCTYRQATSAVYKYRQEKGLIGK